ncbi:hypothetical protein BJAS_P3962 [Bathymodiolus japonicus methanotrophic gill symbiont]|uniref:major capsid protein n=1 Tax=Bathymodiolus japonicus methanotrophic gill symbiont TaxID=113269 RepID=UPI001B5442EB|nr:hypothetical protein [Bathymodiolus japonicus methanotrophic gill symbiont]GFO73250.1 hypothetical protein BJAS_P3962 [Bathymodiolus japonicus methanotrophic gill symbiont]
MAVRNLTRYPDVLAEYQEAGGSRSQIEIIDVMTKNNALLMDANILECNSPNGHKIAIRTGLPETYWTQYYQGHQPSAGTKSVQTEGIAMLKSSCVVDSDLLDSNPNPQQYRLSEGLGNLEAMSQAVVSSVFYGNNKKNKEQFTGLSARYNKLTGSPSSDQIVNGGSTGNDNTSIWFVTWGNRQTSLIHPPETMAGIKRKDLGEQSRTGSNGEFQAMVEEFTWNAGLCVADWRYVTRICNLDVSDIEAGNVLLYDFMRKAYYKHHASELMTGNTVIYCNQTVKQGLEALATNAGAGDNFIRLSSGVDIQGKPVEIYKGYVIHSTQAILDTEARVV